MQSDLDLSEGLSFPIQQNVKVFGNFSCASEANCCVLHRNAKSLEEQRSRFSVDMFPVVEHATNTSGLIDIRQRMKDEEGTCHQAIRFWVQAIDVYSAESNYTDSIFVAIYRLGCCDNEMLLCTGQEEAIADSDFEDMTEDCCHEEILSAFTSRQLAEQFVEDFCPERSQVKMLEETLRKLKQSEDYMTDGDSFGFRGTTWVQEFRTGGHGLPARKDH